MQKPFNFVLIGRSGCGKGTQAKLLIKHFGNLHCITTGDLLRDLAKIGTDAGKRIKKILEKGNLPYDDLAISLWMHEIAYKVKQRQGIIADGFPRRLNEAKTLDRFLEFLDRKQNTFNILIDISREEAFNRLTKRRICKECGQIVSLNGALKELNPVRFASQLSNRVKSCNKCKGELVVRIDDVPDAINNRLDFYERKVMPVIKYYEGQNRLIRINGQQGIENIFKNILKEIKKQDLGR